MKRSVLVLALLLSADCASTAPTQPTSARTAADLEFVQLSNELQGAQRDLYRAERDSRVKLRLLEDLRAAVAAAVAIQDTAFVALMIHDLGDPSEWRTEHKAFRAAVKRASKLGERTWPPTPSTPCESIRVDCHRRGPLQVMRDFYRERIRPYTAGCTPFDEYTCTEEFNQHRWSNYNAQLSAFTSHPSYPEAKVALDREDWKEVRRLIAEMKRTKGVVGR